MKLMRLNISCVYCSKCSVDLYPEGEANEAQFLFGIWVVKAERVYPKVPHNIDSSESTAAIMH